MKSYLSLIPISARVHRKQNRMTILCIVLAVFLVTAVFSMADMGIRMEYASAKIKHGNWHIGVHGISATDAEKIASRPDVAAVSEYDVINYDIKDDYYIGAKRAAVAGMNETFFTDTFDYITEGCFPENENEALVSENAKDIMGVEIGDSITLTTPAGNFEYTISGFERDRDSGKYDAIVLCINMPAFDEVRTANGITTAPEHFYRFNKYTNVRKAINEIKEQFSLTEENVGENVVMVGLSGFSENNVVQGMYAVAAFLFLLILTAGVLMIASSLNSNVMQRTKFFGMLRCTGASKKQIKKFVRCEALYWCKSAVPTGIALGIIITWGLCAALKFGIGGEFSEVPLFGISPVGIILGISVGVITVLIASRSPAKKAASVSPVAAVSGNAYRAKNIRHKTNIRIGKIETVLGINHAVSSKKNLVLMTLSFAFSIILFLGFSAIHDWTRHALNGLQPHTPDLSIVSDDRSCTITRELIDEVGSMPGVKRVVERAFSGNFPAETDKDVTAIDLVSLDAQQFSWAEEEKWSEDKTGLERAYKEDGFVMTVYDKDNPLQKGDKISLNGELFEISCVLTDSPISGSGNPTIMCTEEIFTRLTGETGFAVADIQLARNVSDSDISTIRAAAETNEFLLSDRRENNREVAGTYWAFTLLIYGFLALIAVISVINIVNSISMSVSAKFKQYGAMRAVGMSIEQLIKMISAETLTYTLCGLLVGLAAGVPIHKSFYESFVTAYFGEGWEPPIFAVIIITLFVVAASAAAIYAPSKRIKNMEITDTINEQ